MKPKQPVPFSKTMVRRMEQYRDRWSSYGDATGLDYLSDKLTAEELAAYEIFQDYDEKFLERISPDVSVAVWSEGSVLFEAGTYIDLAFWVVDGEVEVFVEGGESSQQGALPIFDLERTVMSPSDELLESPSVDLSGSTRFLTTKPPSASEITFLATMDFDLPRASATRLGRGELFGEIGALSGWPQSVTARCASQCHLIQIRIPALRAMKKKSKALKERVDRLYRERSLFSQLKLTPLLRDCSDLFLEALKEVVELVSCDPGEVVAREGEVADCLYFVRSGFLKLKQHFGEGEIVVTYLSKGMSLGDVELLVDGIDRWEVTAISVEYAELVRVPRAAFEKLVSSYPDVETQLWQSAVARIKEIGLGRRNLRHSEFTEVALQSGLVQGNSILAIDLERCTRCDDCVRACAATHGGRPRFIREGNKYENLLIAKSCYHCQDPVCLVGCPTGAIHRAGVGDVVEISDAVCIGCSTCASNCPYDSIVMHETGSVWSDDMVPVGLRGRDRQVASKCDLCHETGHSPACVSNCPQGCAYRVGSLEELQNLLKRGA